MKEKRAVIRTIAAAFVVAVVALIAAGPAVPGAGHVLDDQYVLANARSKDLHRYLFAYSVECPGSECTTAWWSAPSYRRHFVRFVPSLLLKAAVTVAGNDGAWLHVCGLAVHLANSLLLLVLLGLLGVEAGWATLVAALFAAHPVGSEMTRATSFVCVPVAATFVLTSLIFWRLFRAEKRARFAVLCIAAVFLAMTSYEAAVLLPVALVIADRILFPSCWPPGGRWPRFAYGCCALLPFYFLLRHLLHTQDIARPLGVLLFPGIRLGVAETVGYVLKTFSLLGWRSLSPYWLHGAVGEIAATLMATAVVVAIAAWSLERPLARVGLSLFAAFLLPPVAVRALVGVFNNPTLRQVYLPLLGAALVVAAHTPVRRMRAHLIGWSVVAGLVVCSWRFSSTMKQPDYGALSAQVQRALADVDPAQPVAWISQPPRYHINYDWPERQEYLLIPPPLDEGELRLCRGDSPRELLALAPRGFAGRRYSGRGAPPGPVPFVDFMKAIWTEPELFRTGRQLLPFGQVSVPDPTREPTTELRYILTRDIENMAFLRYSNGSATRIRPSRCAD